MPSVITQSEEETLQWAREFTKRLKPGDCVGLSGHLGAGKTVICKGICKQLEFEGDVTSPSYALINEYEGVHPIYHIDLYRLNEKSDWQEIGIDHYLNGTGIVLIEWPERFPDFKSLLNYYIEINSKNATERLINYG